MKLRCRLRLLSLLTLKPVLSFEHLEPISMQCSFTTTATATTATLSQTSCYRSSLVRSSPWSQSWWQTIYKIRDKPPTKLFLTDRHLHLSAGLRVCFSLSPQPSLNLQASLQCRASALASVRHAFIYTGNTRLPTNINNRTLIATGPHH